MLKPAKRSVLKKLLFGEEVGLFVDNLALLAASGMDVVLALSVLKREVKTARMKMVIGQIQEDVENGVALSVAFVKTGLFGTNITALIKIGEEAGHLPENLRVAAQSVEKERIFRAKIYSALMYPVFVLALAAVVGIGISWLVLPRLAVVFSQLRVNLPVITKILIAGGVFLGKYGAVFVPLSITLMFFLIYFLFVFDKTKFIGQRMLFAFPLIGGFVSQIEIAHFGFLMGTMLSAGLSLITAFDSLIEVTESIDYRHFYRFIRDKVEEGNSFAKSFALTPDIDRLMPPSVQQMIVAAEQSGSLPETLAKIGERYEQRTEDTTKNIGTALEPALLVVVWFVVFAVALAIILPIYSLIGGFNP